MRIQLSSTKLAVTEVRKLKNSANLLIIISWQNTVIQQSPLNCSFAFCGFIYSKSTMVQKQMIFLMYRQVNSSLTPHQNAYVIHLTSCCSVGILSSLHYHKRRKFSIVKYFEGERPYSHNIFITYCYNSFILLLLTVNLLESLIFILYHRYVYTGKIEYIQVWYFLQFQASTERSYNISPVDEGKLLYS